MNERRQERNCSRNSNTEVAARVFFEHCVQDPPHSVVSTCIRQSVGPGSTSIGHHEHRLWSSMAFAVVTKAWVNVENGLFASSRDNENTGRVPLLFFVSKVNGVGAASRNFRDFTTSSPGRCRVKPNLTEERVCGPCYKAPSTNLKCENMYRPRVAQPSDRISQFRVPSLFVDLCLCNTFLSRTCEFPEDDDTCRAGVQ